MKKIKWTLGLLVLALIGAALHYALPSRDIVRIVGTEVRLKSETRTESDGSTRILQNDIYFIKTVLPNGKPRVFRNEDNGWYFKFDSSNLDTKASNLVSSEADPRWVVVRHYGWRIPVFSMYQNAISIRPAAGPDERLFPWLNIILIAGILVGILIIWRIFAILVRRNRDPVVAEIHRREAANDGWWRRRRRG
ncbi:MAG TPA: DUF1523 family protein [Paracoccaceae bacterium]|nr:DUF1523 family protein [Paracoccaceae bacterium]